MSDIAFNTVLKEVDSFSYNQCVALLEKLSEALKAWSSNSKKAEDDSFYSEKNMEFLQRGAQAIANGQGKEHELIEVD